MTWIAGIAVVAALVWLSLKSMPFRIVLLVAAVLAGAGIWWFEARQAERVRLAEELIRPSEVELAELTLHDAIGTRRVFAGRIKNLSPAYTLSAVSLRLTAYDCPGEEIDAACDIIGQAAVTASVRVPPGQVRSFEQYVSFANMPRPHNFKWSYELDSVRAEVE
jgi:hypothetical protein